MVDWVDGIVADLCSSIDYGLTESAKTKPVGPRFLRITDIVGSSLNWDTVPYVKADTKTATKYSLHDGDIVIARTGATTGESAYISNPPSAIFASYLVRLKAKPDIEPRFLAYWLKSPPFRAYIHGVLGEKSAQPNASAATMTKAPIRYPQLRDDQSKIAKVLSSLDDKIENNRRMNETLEAMAQAIFKDWFVDFGPVHRKASGMTDPVAILGGLITDPEKATQTAALFPDTFGENGLPEGWKSGVLEDLANTVGTSVDPQRLKSETPYFGLEHLPRQSVALNEWGEAANVTSNKLAFEKGQILFGKLRPYFHKVGIAPLDGICSTDIVAMDSKNIQDRALLASIVSSNAFVDFTNQSSTGTKMPRTNWNAMKSYPVTIAEKDIREEFDAIIQPAHSKIVQSITENKALAETRDYLLPRLMSGQIRAGAVDKAVC